LENISPVIGIRNESVPSSTYPIEMRMMTIRRGPKGTLPIRVFLFVSLIAGNARFAQVDRAGLSEPVTDSSGRKVQESRITTLKTAMGLVRESVSSLSGVYDIAELPIGLYRVTCSATGFQLAVFNNVEQTVGQRRTLDITLAVSRTR
jgi:hypothetical protein